MLLHTIQIKERINGNRIVFFSIGNNNSNQWDPDLGGAGPHTLLHLEGPNNTGFIGRAVV
ncbi:MAG: hypothetical protein IPP71_10935 [Bacteroidetes bacterium]|nr:hypothetical protein [Bacteroidota bacterium]